MVCVPRLPLSGPHRSATGSPNTAMAEFVFTMHNVRKTLGEKLILDNVTMSFYPDAKIGVVGPNGAGKSTMLKIMAGLENANNGDVMLAKGKTVGMLMQEPPLTEDKTVLENVQEGVAETRALLDRYNEISAELADPDADYDTLLAEMGDLSTELDHRKAWELDSESVAWLEGHLKAYPGAVLAVTHDRYFLDNVAGWICEVDRGQLHPYEGNYSTYLATTVSYTH